MIKKLWIQTPLGAIFDEIYFVLCNYRSVRNSSDFLIVKNPIDHFHIGKRGGSRESQTVDIRGPCNSTLPLKLGSRDLRSVQLIPSTKKIVRWRFEVYIRDLRSAEISAPSRSSPTLPYVSLHGHLKPQSLRCPWLGIPLLPPMHPTKDRKFIGLWMIFLSNLCIFTR